MYAMVKLVLLLDLKAITQAWQGWAIRIAAIAMQPKITHDGSGQAPTGISKAQHMQFAERDLTTRKNIWEKRGDIRSGADHNARGGEKTFG